VSGFKCISKINVYVFQTPTSAEEWQEIADGFETKWNYPCCIGALDGKHIAVQQPLCTGSEFFNYKHFFSVLLLGLVDANYKFVYVDVGASGRAGDAGVISESSLKEALENDLLDVPPPACVQGMPHPLHFHIVADDAFPLSNTIMKPYPHRKLDKPNRIFNYRLSRARRVVENAFGILANRWRVFHTTIGISPEKVVNLVLAACCLHNFLVEHNKQNYLGVRDVEEIGGHNVVPGTWRTDAQLTGLCPTVPRKPQQSAKCQRAQLTEYFNSDAGSVPWQDHIIKP
jgi:hypothetical protein